MYPSSESSSPPGKRCNAHCRPRHVNCGDTTSSFLPDGRSLNPWKCTSTVSHAASLFGGGVPTCTTWVRFTIGSFIDERRAEARRKRPQMDTQPVPSLAVSEANSSWGDLEGNSEGGGRAGEVWWRRCGGGGGGGRREAPESCASHVVAFLEVLSLSQLSLFLSQRHQQRLAARPQSARRSQVRTRRRRGCGR